MRRLIATLACDLRLQYRYRFPLAAAFSVLAWVPALLLASDAGLDRLLPSLVLCNLLVTAFYFTAAQVHREKAEGTLAMRDATPLRPHEYLAAKALSLTALSVLAGLGLVLLVRGPAFRPLPFLLGSSAAGVILVFAGFFAASRHATLKAFLPSSLIWVLAFLPPLLPGFGLSESPVMGIHPLHPPLTLLRAAFTGTGASAGELAYGIAASAAWALLGLRAGKSGFERLRQAGE